MRPPGEGAARALLSAGADVNFRSDKWGSLLHAAAKAGKHLPMVKVLLAYGADVELLHEDMTPEQLAEQRGHAEVAALLRKWAQRRAARVASDGA